MSRHGWSRCGAQCLALLLVGTWTGGARGQAGPPPSLPVEATAPGVAVLTPEATRPLLPPEIQIVRFQGPPGVNVEVLGPPPEAVPIGDGHGLATFGLRVGVGYQLRLSNLPDRPGVAIYPYIELVGHLHRPPGVDPARFPIRVQFTTDDFDDVIARSRLVTQVVYLEDPNQALPLHLPKDEIPLVSLSPVEPPIKVAAALGRIMAIVRIGTRAPGPEDLTGATIFCGSGSLPLPTGLRPGDHCPFLVPDVGPCTLPCGPVCETPPPPSRPWLPRDEFLCDGGDFGKPAGLTSTGGLAGVDPRDAVMTFSRATMLQLQPELDKLRNEMDALGQRRDRQEISASDYESGMRRLEIQARRLRSSAADVPNIRVLPTNVVCIYAPRFAAVRVGLGPNEARTVEYLKGAETVERQVTEGARVGPQKLTRNQTAEINRHRSRASGLVAREGIGRHIEVRVLASADLVEHIAGHVVVQGPETRGNKVLPQDAHNRLRLGGIKSAEGVVVTGLVQGAGEQVMAWKPQELATVEQPPNRPGVVIVKQVDQSEAEPGDVVTYTLTYRNMGNVPITSVSVVDSLLPRLEYVKGSARGPQGAVFTAAENQAGSQELRWDIGTLAPGQQGAVSFQAKVR